MQTSKKKLDSTKYFSTSVIDKNHFVFRSDSAYLKGEMAYFEENSGKALKYFKEALLFNPHSIYLHQRIAAIYEKEGLFAEALYYYQTLKTKKKQNAESQKKLTELYRLTHLYKKAFENQKEYLQKYPERFSAWFEQTLLLSYQGRWEEALKALDQADQKALSSEQKSRTLLPRAYILAKLQRPAEVLNILKQLENTAYKTEEFAITIADFYKSLGQPSLAIQYLETIQKTQMETGLISKVLLKHYLSKSKWKQALQQIRNIETLGQLEEPHYFYMALLYLEKKNYAKAMAYLKDLLMKTPKQGQYLYLLAFAYEKKQKWFLALQTYNQIGKFSPHFLSAQLQIAHVWKQIGQKERSFALLKKLSFPTEGKARPHPILLYAESLWDSGYEKQALTLLTKSLKLIPSHPDILFLRGLYLKKSGQPQLAVQDIKRILKKKTEHEEALNFLADFYSEQKVNLNEAEQLARKAVSLKPHSSSFLNTLGWILFQKGRWESALYYLNKAYSGKKNKLIAKRLGKVYLSLKDFKKSDYFFKEAERLKKHEENNKTKRDYSIPRQTLIH